MPRARRPARLIVLDTGQVIPLPAPPLIVGRRDPVLGPAPDIALTDPTRQVGRRHARIEKKEGYTIQDLNSRNKTTLNGVTLTPGQEYPLHDGDMLTFGPVKVRFER